MTLRYDALFFACAALGLGAAASAQPISFAGTLLDGEPQFGSVSSAGGEDDQFTAEFWTFFGEQGDTVTIQALRLEQDFDPAFWVFEGAIAELEFFAGGDFPSIDFADPGFLDFADDEILATGPFGDPLSEIVLTLPGTGQYTVAVTNFASGPDDGGDGFFDYEITAFGTVVPEPTSACLASLLLSAVGLRWRLR